MINAATLGPHARTPDKVDMLDLQLNLHNYGVSRPVESSSASGATVESRLADAGSALLDKQGRSDVDSARSVTGVPEEPFAYIARACGSATANCSSPGGELSR